MFRMKFAFAVLALAATVSSQCDETEPIADCKCFPGDDCWPTAEEWREFNSTIDGQLIATVPLASPCHDDEWASYDNATCIELQEAWLNPETQYV